MRNVLPSRILLAVLMLALAVRAAAQAPAAEAPAIAVPAAQADREIQVASDAFTKDARVPAWVVPRTLSESRAEGPAVIRLLDHQILVGTPNVVYVRNAIQVNNTAALTPLGRVPIAFIPAYQKVVLHTLQITRDGAVLDRLAGAQVRFLQRETGLENNIYSGVVTASILLDDLRVGDTLEIAYSVVGSNPVFGRTYAATENWDQSLPVDDRRVILTAPVQRPIRWRFHGDLAKNFPKPSEQTVGGLRSLVFEERDLPRVVPETATPAGFGTFRWLQFSEYDDWQGVADWAASLFDVHEAPDAERAKLVASLMTRPTVEERIVGALEFVQSQIRYFSVSLGTSSHQPTLPDTVLARRYGDCKDKSLLLVTLLADMGIPSTPVLARLGNRTGFDEWLPSPFAFDHVIVAVDVDGRRYWLDSTRQAQHGRLATMGQVHDGAQVLPASRSDGRLQRVEVADRDLLNRNELTETLTVPRLDGDGTFRVVQVLHGVAAELVRASNGLATKERIDETLVDDMRKRYPGAALLESLRIDDDPLVNRVTLTSAFTLRKPIAHADGQYRAAFRAGNFNRVFTLPGETARRSPVVLRYPVDVVYRFVAELPPEVAVVDSHGTAVVENRHFTASARLAFVANHAEVTMQLKTLADRVAADDLPALREDLHKLDQRFPSAIVFRDADVKASGFLGIGTRDLASSLRAREEDTIARVTATIRSGRLAGGDLARAYCTRAQAAAALERRDDASQDADRAVDVDPNAPASLVCRAEVRLQIGRFAPAAEDASQAIVLGSDTGAPWQARGQARFHLGRYAEAAEDFAKAATVDHDDRQNANHDVWRAMAYRRMQKPLQKDLADRANDARRQPWPLPALALFADRIGPDELATIAAGKSGDEGAMVGTEADFYRGEFYLATGDRVRAREAFAAARARGIVAYVEYHAAAFELEHLAP